MEPLINGKTDGRAWARDAARYAFEFSRELVSRFVRDDCVRSSAELAFITALSVAPATAVAFPILLTFPFFRGSVDAIIDFLLTGFVPTGTSVIKEHVLEFARRAGQLTLPTLFILLGTVILTLATVEDRINGIWRITRRRHWLPRLLVYWTLVTLGPALLVAGLAVTSYLASLAIRDRDTGVAAIVLRALPFATSLLAFLLLYVAVPARRVPLWAGLSGATTSAVLFELAKKGFAIYATQYSSYASLYGALAVLPIFLLWIYSSWLITLFGTELTCCLATYHPDAHHAHRRETELERGVRLLAKVDAFGRLGRTLTPEAWEREERDAPWEAMFPLAERFAAKGILFLTEEGNLALVRPLQDVTLRDVHRALACPLPEPDGLPGDNPLRAGVGRAEEALDEALLIPLADLIEEGRDGQADSRP